MASSNGNGANYVNGLPPLPIGMHKTRQAVSSSYYPIASMPSAIVAPSKHEQRQQQEHRSSNTTTTTTNNNNQNYLQQQFFYNQHQQQQRQQNVGQDSPASLEQDQHHHKQHQQRHFQHQYIQTANLGLGEQQQQQPRVRSPLPAASSHRRTEPAREYFHDTPAISHHQHQQHRPANCNYLSGSQDSNRCQKADGREMMSEQQQQQQQQQRPRQTGQQQQQQQHHKQHSGAISSPSMSTSKSNSPRQSRCQINDCPCDEPRISSATTNTNQSTFYQHQHQDQDDGDDDDDDDETNCNSNCGGGKYADQLRRSQQRIGLHQHQHHQSAGAFIHSEQQQQQQKHQQQQHQAFNFPQKSLHNQQFGANNEAAPSELHQKTSRSGSGTAGPTGGNREEARAPLHVNFGTRSSQSGPAGAGPGANTNGTCSELEDEGEGETTRKKKYLTAKYGQQQMSLIKKRLKIEMWLHEQLQELAKRSQTIGPEELDEIDIDLDQLLDLEDDATRQHSLRKTLAPLSDLPAADINKFISDVLEQSKLL